MAQVLCVNNTIANASSVVFKKDKRIDFDGFFADAQKYRLAGDWYFYSKVLLHGKVAYCDDSLNYHRMHDAGVTLTTGNYVHYNEIVAVQDSIKRDIKLPNESIKKIKIRRDELLRSFGFSEEIVRLGDVDLQKLVKKQRVDDEVLLSVIVCGYNAEDYIGNCLKSVFAALPERSEVIVVDDGSCDKTLEIAKQYRSLHDNIRCYHKENGGLSSAKNYGLKRARGRYVIFMDSDDEIAQNGYELMLKKAIEEKSDMVICDMELIYNSGDVKYCRVCNDKHKDVAMRFLDNGLMASSNNKMVRRELFKGLTYPEGKNNEDIAVTPALIVTAKNIRYLACGFYKYYQRKGSIQNSEFTEKRLVIFDTCKMAVENAVLREPEKREMIEGAIVSNQLLAILIYVIVDIPNKTRRGNLIVMFCERYSAMVQGDNRYIDEYLRMVGMNELKKLISLGNSDEISRYIRKCRRKRLLENILCRIFNIKRKENQ